MQIFKRIKSVKYHITRLKEQLSFIKDAKKLKHQIEMINDLILLINDIEFMLAGNISLKTMDRLILSHIHMMIDKYMVNGKVDIHTIVYKIDEQMQLPASYHIEMIVQKLQDAELDMIVNAVPREKTGGNWKKFGVTWPKTRLAVSNGKLVESVEKLKNMTTSEEYTKMINGLLDQFKQSARWN